MEAKVIQVTPAMAQKWLNEHNPHNRPLYEKTIEAYAADMKKGLWTINNQGIGFDEEGNLLDGQHRLYAIVFSGVTVPLLVIRGLPNKFFDGHVTQETIDRGKPRSIGDILTLSHGMENASLRAAMAAILANLSLGNTSIKMTSGITLEIIKIYQGEMDAVMQARSAVKGLLYAPALGAFCFAAKPFKDKTIEFEKQYFSGENLAGGDPILAFRNFMQRRPPGVGGGAFRRIVWNNALTCLMHYVRGERLRKLVQSYVGYEFFANKQQKFTNRITELFKY